LTVEANFCFRCGRHIGRQALKCWYCAAPTRREIRPPRRCPFCDEPIRPKAIKCHNCGEYLDGRDRPAAVSGAAPTPDLVVEHEIAPEPSRPALPGRERLRLEAPSVRELPASASRLVGPQSLKALPPAETSDSSASVPAVSASRALIPTGKRGSDEPPAGDRELAVVESSGAPAPPEVRPSDLLPAVVGAVRSGVEAVARVVRERRAPAARRETEITVETEEDRYRLCPVCGTEMLKLDGYCFHCGQRNAEGLAIVPTVRQKSNVSIYALVILLLLVHLTAARWLGPWREEWVRPVELAAGGAAPLAAVWALLRRRGWVGRVIPLLFLAVALGVVLWF